VGHPDTYALFGILIRGSADSAALRYVVAAHPQKEPAESARLAVGPITWVIARRLSKYGRTTAAITH
jgi:hypothetical protein